MTSKILNKMLSGFEGKQEDLIPILQSIQGKFGFLSEIHVKQAARFLKISENQIFGVASFYSQFRFTEPGRNSIKVCLGTACHVRGGQILSDAVERDLEITHGQTTTDKRFDFERVACLGCCALGPVMEIDGKTHGKISPANTADVINRYD